MLYTEKRPFITRLPIHPQRIPMFIKRWQRKGMLRKYRNLHADWHVMWTTSFPRDSNIRKPYWPDDKKFAVVLTHDVDTNNGVLPLALMTGMERAFDVRSAIYIPSLLKELDTLYYLEDLGFELGSHGYNHDNKLAYLSYEKIKDRFEYIPLKCKGFRSPAYLRTRTLIKVVESSFEYDSSIPDVGLLPYRNGCLTILPFMLTERLVELPVTMPPDGLLRMLGNTPEQILQTWIRKYEYIKTFGGMVNLNTHPEPSMSGNQEMLYIYQRFLHHITKDKDTGWFALPREVAKHWKENVVRN